MSTPSWRIRLLDNFFYCKAVAAAWNLRARLGYQGSVPPWWSKDSAVPPRRGMNAGLFLALGEADLNNPGAGGPSSLCDLPTPRLLGVYNSAEVKWRAQKKGAVTHAGSNHKWSLWLWQVSAGSRGHWCALEEAPRRQWGMWQSHRRALGLD